MTLTRGHYSRYTTCLSSRLTIWLLQVVMNFRALGMQHTVSSHLTLADLLFRRRLSSFVVFLYLPAIYIGLASINTSRMTN